MSARHLKIAEQPDLVWQAKVHLAAALRLAVRDQLEETAILAMILAQMTDEDRMKQATYVIQNHGSLDDLRAQAQKVLDQINTA